MRRRIAYAGTALTAVLAAVVLTAPAASADTDWNGVEPDAVVSPADSDWT